MTVAARPSNTADTAAILMALIFTLIWAFLVICALEGRPSAALDLDEVKVIGDEHVPTPVSHRDAAPVECDDKKVAAGGRCQTWIRPATF